MEKISVEKINFDLEYEGYIWYSNQSLPEQRNKISKSDFTDLPFIVEGNLYSEKDEISINIKNIDGEYFITQGILKICRKIKLRGRSFSPTNWTALNRLR